MIEAQNLFSSLIEDSGIHVDLGDDVKYALKGEGEIFFQLESVGSFESQDVLDVPRLRRNSLLVPAMENRIVCSIVPGSEGEPIPGGSLRITFHAKRECWCW
jgi:hypothetical protein